MPHDAKQWRELLLDMHPDWTHHLWTEENAGELGLEHWQWEHSTLAGSSNIIRLHAVHALGGVYLDTDVECLQPLYSLLTKRAFVARQSDGPLCNAFFGAEKSHPWVQWQIENLKDAKEHDAAHACHVMTRAPLDGVTVIPTEWVYPWNWSDEPDPSRITKRTLAVHWWQGSWIAK